MSQHQQILEETQKLIQVLRDPNASDSQKADTASSLRLLVGSDEAKQLAVEKQGAVPPLVTKSPLGIIFYFCLYNNPRGS